jgi:hypothetical protein
MQTHEQVDARCDRCGAVFDDLRQLEGHYRAEHDDAGQGETSDVFASDVSV